MTSLSPLLKRSILVKAEFINKEEVVLKEHKTLLSIDCIKFRDNNIYKLVKIRISELYEVDSIQIQVHKICKC